MQKDQRASIKYLNKDFESLRNGLIEFAKVYYPDTFNDFTSANPGMMFIEMMAYIGDILSYYTDTQLTEQMLFLAQERKNIINLANTLGYQTRPSFPSYSTVNVFQVVPSIGSGENIKPDFRYGLTLKSNMILSAVSDSSIKFRTLDDIDFTFSSSLDSTEVAVFEYDNSNVPSFYQLKKQIKVVAGEIVTTDLTFSAPERFIKKVIGDNNILEIINVVDSDNNIWYEVPYLAQDTIFVEVENIAANDPELSQYNNIVPYLLKLKKVPRRFTTRITPENTMELRFGSGISNNPDELIVPNPTNIGYTLTGHNNRSLDQSIDPVNFLFTQTYGQVPANTTLTIKYSRGGGFKSNVVQSDIQGVNNVTFSDSPNGLNQAILGNAKNSISAINIEPAVGGRDAETVEEIRHNAMAHFSTQNRAVTKEDYIVRVLSMPSRYGSIAKVYVVQDDQLNQSDSTFVSRDILGNKISEVTGRPSGIPNPLAINMYVLGYNANKQLTKLNRAVKENLKVYLEQYRLLTDAINIKDGFIINIGVKFEIVVFRNYPKREIVLRCIQRIKEYFNIDNWQFNQPIVLSDLITELSKLEGVQSVASVKIENFYDKNLGYSGNIYDIKSATRDGVIYPSMDPSIWEILKQDDIKGRAL